MPRPRSVRQALLIAVPTFVLCTALIVVVWAALDSSWSLVFLPLMVVAGLSAYTYVLARKGK